MKNIFSPIRFSHITSFSGIGSLLRDVDDNLVVIPDITKWEYSKKDKLKYSINNVNRVKCYLGIPHKRLIKPPAESIDAYHLKDKSNAKTIPAIIFPKWTKCTRCGLLHYNPWKEQEDAEKIQCSKSGCLGNLEQVSWVVISNYGHLDEVPWHYFAHDNNQCRIEYGKHYLMLSDSGKGRPIITCSKPGCNAKKELSNKPIKNDKIRFQPWQPDYCPDPQEDLETVLVSVSDPRIYSHVLQRAIVIPPESRKHKDSLTDKIINDTECFNDLSDLDTAPPLKRKTTINKYSKSFNCTSEQLLKAYHEIIETNGAVDDVCNVADLAYDEFKAFTTEITDFKESEDFITSEKTNEWRNLGNELINSEIIPYLHVIDKLVIAQRLRVIEIFKGFYRLKQQEPNKMVKPDLDDSEDWIPAIELFGEGIFVSFPEEKMREWEAIDGVIRRTNELSLKLKNLDGTLQKDLEPTSRFVFLHTFAHLLIKELENSAGYPASSLKERLFCSNSSKMAGVLIYVAVPDIVGTLGGIIEKGDPKEFLSILMNVLNKADWCSYDPICSESDGHGPANLNRAACNACLYLPETACEYNNIFLDRIYLRGDEHKGIPKFIDFIKEYENGKKKI